MEKVTLRYVVHVEVSVIDPNNIREHETAILEMLRDVLKVELPEHFKVDVWVD